jgi:hypothetical protein
MVGYRYSTDRRLPERDLIDLADVLALQIHETLGPRVYMLPRHDVLTLITPYVDDLVSADQHDLSWMIWHLFQDAREFEQHG